MKDYINLFSTLLIPLSLLMTTIATVYYSTNFTLSKAIKLGIVTGVLASIVITLILILLILLHRKIYKNKHRVSRVKYVNLNKTPKVFQNYHENHNTYLGKVGSIEKKIILLMDKELAYEVSLESIKKQHIGEIIYQNKNKGLILLKDDLKELKIDINALTKHTAEIFITSTLEHRFIKTIISQIKIKENLFLNY